MLFIYLCNISYFNWICMYIFYFILYISELFYTFLLIIKQDLMLLLRINVHGAFRADFNPGSAAPHPGKQWVLMYCWLISDGLIDSNVLISKCIDWFLMYTLFYKCIDSSIMFWLTDFQGYWLISKCIDWILMYWLTYFWMYLM